MGAEKKGSITPEQKSELVSLSAEVLKLKEGIPAMEDQARAATKSCTTFWRRFQTCRTTPCRWAATRRPTWR